jgi:hypothetical protein
VTRVIGSCWHLEAAIFINLEKDFYELTASPAAFEALPPSDRFRLTWQERTNTRRYAAVWAAPLKAKHRVIGIFCVGLRASTGEPGADRPARLEGALMETKSSRETVPKPRVSTILHKSQSALHGSE